MPELTDVYFLSDNQYGGIYKPSASTADNVGFCNDYKLVNVYLPKTEYFKYIGNYSFQDCFALTTIADDGTDKLSDLIEEIQTSVFYATFAAGKTLQVRINGLPANLRELGTSAFQRAGDYIVINEIPEGVKLIRGWALSYCPNVNISTFGTNTVGVGLEEISGGALYNCGINVEDIKLLKSIVKLESDRANVASRFGAFDGYAPNLKTFSSVNTAEEIVDQDGLPLGSFVITGIRATTIIEAL